MILFFGLICYIICLDWRLCLMSVSGDLDVDVLKIWPLLNAVKFSNYSIFSIYFRIWRLYLLRVTIILFEICLLIFRYAWFKSHILLCVDVKLHESVNAYLFINVYGYNKFPMRWFIVCVDDKLHVTFCHL